LSGRYTCQECQAPNPSSEAKGGEAVCVSCGGELYQRDDDRAEAVARRLRVYQTETFPLLDYYRQRGLLIEVPGVGSVEEVNQWVHSALDKSPVDPD
jgi:adenylate kinase